MNALRTDDVVTEFDSIITGFATTRQSCDIVKLLSNRITLKVIASHRKIWDVVTYPCSRYMLLAPLS